MGSAPIAGGNTGRAGPLTFCGPGSSGHTAERFGDGIGQ